MAHSEAYSIPPPETIGGTNQGDESVEGPTATLYPFRRREEPAEAPSEVSALRALEAARDLRSVSLARNGDENELNDLLGRYEPLLRFVASNYFLAGGENDDLLQEGRIGLYKAIRDYDPSQGTSFRSFAWLCMYRQIITAIKTATRFKHQPLNQYVSFSHTPRGLNDDSEELTLGDSLPGSAVEEPPVVVISTEELQSLVFALGTGLSGLESDCLKLFLEGCSYEEIANELGIDYKAVDNSLQRVKRKIKAHQEGREALLDSTGRESEYEKKEEYRTYEGRLTNPFKGVIYDRKTEVVEEATEIDGDNLSIPTDDSPEPNQEVELRKRPMDLLDITFEIDDKELNTEALGLTHVNEISLLEIISKLDGRSLIRAVALEQDFYNDGRTKGARSIAFHKTIKGLIGKLEVAIGRPVIKMLGTRSQARYVIVAPFEFNGVRVPKSDEVATETDRKIEALLERDRSHKLNLVDSPKGSTTSAEFWKSPIRRW